jgi:hypothetical protein
MAEKKGAVTPTPTIPTIVAPLTTNEPVEFQPEQIVQAAPEPTPEPSKDAAWWESKAKAMEKEKESTAKKLAKLEDDEKKREEAKLSELEKLQKQLVEVEKRAAEAERKSIRQKVAAETGLPVILAERLQGEDEEAMRADAAKLLEALPKPVEQKKGAPNINPTNPAAAQQGETPAQKRARLHLTPEVNIFSEGADAALGGGVFLVGNE